VIHHDILNNLCISGLLEHPRHNTQKKTTHFHFHWSKSED